MPRIRHLIAVALLFASNGLLLASLLPWYPNLKLRFELSDFSFGLVVASVAVGSILSSAMPAILLRRCSPWILTVTGTIVMAGLLNFAPHLNSAVLLGVLIGLLGLLDPVVDVAQNLIAMRVQTAGRKSWMSSWHACWSLGAATGGALGTWAVGHIGMPLHMALASVVATALALVGVVLLGSWGNGREVPVASEATGASKSTGLWWLVAPLVVVAVAGAMVEEVANSWAALAAHGIGGMPVERAGMAFTVMLAAQCVGRFLGDPMINRLGRVNVGRLGGVLIAVGGVLAMAASGPMCLLVGLACAGFGSATIVPSAFAAAAELPGMAAGSGLTMVSWLLRIGFVATSPIIGFISDLTSLRTALGIVVVGGLAIVGLARALSTRVSAR